MPRRNLRILPEVMHVPDPTKQNVKPDGLASDRKVLPASRTRHINREIAFAVYHWATCLLLSVLVLAQLSGAVWNTTNSVQYLHYGHDPLLGPFQVVGKNDVPFTDRVVACTRYGEHYVPRVVSSLLSNKGVDAILEHSTGAAHHGYRLVQRRVGSMTDGLDSRAYDSYCTSCELIANTLDSIFDACLALGYTNLTRDNLRVVENATSNRLFRLPNTLPILIMPFWDNAELARHAIPTYDGDACVFRLEDAYFGGANGGSDTASFRGVNQSVRHENTLKWLKKPDGVWRNGWYEDLEGGRWFADVMSSTNSSPYFMQYRMIDMWTGLERNCTEELDCLSSPTLDRWGSKFVASSLMLNLNSITISNASSFAIFLYKTEKKRVIHTEYDWQTLLSNLSVGRVLIRWFMSLVALHVGAVSRGIESFGGGIGCVSNSQTFDFLLVSMLPQLKMTLTAFWTVGCYFEGEQSGLSEAWSTIYPAIAQLMLMYFSLLNVLAKIFRRRMSDVLFAPSVAFLCFLHFFRAELAAATWVEDVDGRVATAVFSDEINKLQLIDYITTDIAWRMNGRFKSIFVTKLIVLGVNFLPLLFAKPFPIQNRHSKQRPQGIEKALAIRTYQTGGLGTSPTYLAVEPDNTSAMIKVCPTTTDSTTQENMHGSYSHESTASSLALSSESTSPRTYLNSYELVRLGYLVYGDKYLITFDEWDLLSAMAPLRAYCYLWNHRVFVWKLNELPASGENSTGGMRALVGSEPEMWRLDDQRLQSIRWWQVSSCAIKC